MLNVNLAGNGSCSIANNTVGVSTLHLPTPNRNALHLSEIKKLSRLDFH